MNITINKQKITVHPKISLTVPQSRQVKKWIEALLSGKYKQGQGVLCSNEKYCCLGVACVTTGTRIYLKGDKAEPVAFGTENDNSDVHVPFYVTKKLGIAYEDGSPRKTTESSLTSLNDNGKKFATIAKTLIKDLQTNKFGYFKQK